MMAFIKQKWIVLAVIAGTFSLDEVAIFSGWNAFFVPQTRSSIILSQFTQNQVSVSIEAR